MYGNPQKVYQVYLETIFSVLYDVNYFKNMQWLNQQRISGDNSNNKISPPKVTSQSHHSMLLWFILLGVWIQDKIDFFLSEKKWSADFEFEYIKLKKLFKCLKFS